MEFSDSLFTLQLPYQSVYGQGATLHLAFVKDNEVYTRDIRINRRIENSRLQYKWHTFRDKLTPGAREEWTLQLTDSKGEPVSARCFFTLYDASLDAIRRHYWRLSLPTIPYLAMPYWSSRYLSVTSFGINFPWKHELQPVESWSDLNLRLLGFATGGGMVKNAKMLYQTNGAVSTCRMASPKMLAEAVVAENEVAMDMAAAPSLETHPAVRKNLQETAYFNAELNTDEEGKVKRNENGLIPGHYEMPNIKALNDGLYWMVSAGMEIEAEMEQKPLKKMDRKQLLRKVDLNPYELGKLLHKEFARCFERKNG